MSLSLLNTILRLGLFLFIGLGFLMAINEGASWEHRKSGVVWWWTFRPDRLFRSEFYTPEGERLRRRAARLLLAVAILGVLLILGLLYRDALESRALAV